MITCKFEDGNEAGLRHIVVDVLIIKDDRILLTKRAPGLLEGGKWALAGGFMERDETLEQTVLREIMEETGWEVANIQLMSIIDNPHRPGDPDRQNIAFNFVCRAVKQVGKSDDEVTEQQWFDLDNLPAKEEVAFDHYQVIENYRADRSLSKGIGIINKKAILV